MARVRMPSPRAFRPYDPSAPSNKQSPSPLDEFLPESPSERARFASERRSNRWPVQTEVVAPERTRSFTVPVIGIGLIVGLIVSAITLLPGVASLASPATRAPVVISESTATLTSTPDGADVYIDGVHVGKTPISLSLPVGVRVAELRNAQTSRRASLRIEAGKITAQHVDFGGAPSTGGLEVSSDPRGARVSIDGTPRGQTPLKIPEIAPGQHKVTISSGRTSVERTVEVTAGATATVVVSVPAAAAAATNGFVAIDGPAELEVFEGGRHLGSGRAARISLPSGRHTLELLNRSIGFRTEATVNVVAGQSVTLNVPMPSGSLSINALPWAEVWIDGRAIGQTPIGNVSVSIGTHEVVWRHPQHGQRRQTVVVTAAEPVRVGIDWTR
jgi:hypothetical protein